MQPVVAGNFHESSFVSSVRHESPDRTLVAEFVATYTHRLMLDALLVLKNVHDAEDAVDSTFFQVIETKFGNYDETRPLGPWMRRVCRNRAIDILRKKTLSPIPNSEFVDQNEPAAPEPVPVWDELGLTLIPRVKDLLSERQWEVIRLTVIEGCAHVDVAHELEMCSTRTVASTKSNAIAKLRNDPQLQKLFEEWCNE